MSGRIQLERDASPGREISLMPSQGGVGDQQTVTTVYVLAEFVQAHPENTDLLYDGVTFSSSNCRPVRRPRQSVGGTQRNGGQQLSDRL
jgi:hypothetical protein